MASKALILVALGAAALAAVAMSGSAHAEPKPQPSPGPQPFPSPAPAPTPVPPTKGLGATELAHVAADDVRAHGWNSGRGVVRAFQAAYNAEQAQYTNTLAGPPAAAIKVDDKWGPESFNAALHEGVVNPPAAYFHP